MATQLRRLTRGGFLCGAKVEEGEGGSAVVTLPCGLSIACRFLEGGRAELSDGGALVRLHRVKDAVLDPELSAAGIFRGRGGVLRSKPLLVDLGASLERFAELAERMERLAE